MELEKPEEKTILDRFEKKTKSKLVTARFSEEEKERLDKITEKYKLTKTAFIRKAVILYMGLLGESEDTFFEDSFFQKLISKLSTKRNSINHIEKRVKDTENIINHLKIPEKDINRLVRNWIEKLLI